MKIFNGLSEVELPLRGSVLTIGNFDGVHAGHRALISQTIEKARENGAVSVVMTFFPHPSQILRPASPTARLFDLEDLKEQLKELGLDVLIVEPFTKEFSQLSAEEFIQNRIVPKLNPLNIFVGYDFSFGHDRGGSLDVLQSLAKKLKFSVATVAPLLIEGKPISSSVIRELIRAGEVDKVPLFLMRHFYLSAVVVRGEGRGGKKIGFPTANMKADTEIIPQTGVYITRLWLGEKSFPSVTNVGRKPTFHENFDLTVETHILDWHREIYGEKVKVEFLKRIRPELKFSNIHDLIIQIEQDVRDAKKYFGS